MTETLVLHVRDPQTSEVRHLLTFAKAVDAFENGVPPQAIMGRLVDGPDGFQPEHFQTNPAFVAFLHEVMASHVARCPDLVAVAAEQGGGYVYVLDGRTPTPQGEVPAEDIVGAAAVEAGSVRGYQGNPNFRVIGAHGVMQLTPWWWAVLREALSTL